MHEKYEKNIWNKKSGPTPTRFYFFTLNKTFLAWVDPKPQYFYSDRLCVSAMHFNENSDRKQKINKKGEECYAIVYKKANKGTPTCRPRKEAPTFRKYI